MKCYFLLRNNRESGPFTLEQLKACNLLSTDLVWVENESRAWEHPTEIEELQAVVKTNIQENVDFKETASTPAFAKPAAPSLQEYKKALGSEEVYQDEDHPTYYYKSKTVFRERRTPETNSFSVGSGFFGAVILLIGLGLCGFVVVNMLKQFSPKREASSEAVEIKSEVLPSSNTAHTAQAPVQLSLLPQTANATPAVVDTLHAKTTPEKKPVKTSVPAAKKAQRDTTNKNAAAIAETVSNDETQSKPVEEKAEPAPIVNRAPSLQLSANDYKVGLFGGVSNLEISVSNPSGQKIGKALIEVEFLKPNGSVVKSETVTAENIAANGSAKIAVPSSSRGVKVRYHVVSVTAEN